MAQNININFCHRCTLINIHLNAETPMSVQTATDEAAGQPQTFNIFLPIFTDFYRFTIFPVVRSAKVLADGHQGHPAFNIQRSTFDIQRSTFNVRHSMNLHPRNSASRFPHILFKMLGPLAVAAPGDGRTPLRRG
jgi:hypothetical protein